MKTVTWISKANNNTPKRCLICKCELPENSKLPICAYHRDKTLDKSKKLGFLVVGGLASLFALSKTEVIDKTTDGNKEPKG